jgi:hypothetical protein
MLHTPLPEILKLKRDEALAWYQAGVKWHTPAPPAKGH